MNICWIFSYKANFLNFDRGEFILKLLQTYLLIVSAKHQRVVIEVTSNQIRYMHVHIEIIGRQNKTVLLKYPF